MMLAKPSIIYDKILHFYLTSFVLCAAQISKEWTSLEIILLYDFIELRSSILN